MDFVCYVTWVPSFLNHLSHHYHGPSWKHFIHFYEDISHDHVTKCEEFCLGFLTVVQNLLVSFPP